MRKRQGIGDRERSQMISLNTYLRPEDPPPPDHSAGSNRSA